MINLLKVLEKMNIKSIMIYYVMKLFLNCDFKNYKQYLKCLNELHKDEGKSSYRENNLETFRFDLQIIVPAYNCKDSIKECIESIINQETNFSYCLIVIDDGSTDGTSEILDEEKNMYPQIQIVHQENKGLSGARNEGLKKIYGRYVLFVDSDDTIPSQAIEHLLQAASTTKADIIEGGYNRVNSRGRVTKTVTHKNCKNVDPYKELYGYPWGKLYKAELFEKVAFPENYWFEDTVAMYRLWNKTDNVVTINNIVYNYFDNKKGITHTSRGNTKVIDSLYVTMKLLSDYFDHDYSKDTKQEIYDFTLGQIRMNTRRLSSLKSREVNKANFSISCFILKRYFLKSKTQNKNLKKLESSLRTNNYPLFMVSAFNCI